MEVQVFLDALDQERLEERRLLEDLVGLEDGPETDALILARCGKAAE